MFASFLKPYATEDLVVQTRARNLLWVLIGLVAAMVGLGILSFFNPDGLATGVLALVVIALFAGSFWLLGQGRYTTAANLTFVVLVASCVAGALLNRIGEPENDMFRLTAMFSMGVVLTTFFGYGWWMGVTIGLAGLATMGVIVLTPATPEVMARDLNYLQSVGSPLSVVVIFLMTSGVAALGLLQTGRILQRTKASQAIAEEGFADVRQIFVGTQAGLEVSREMEEASRGLSRGAKKIDEELTILEAQTKNLQEQSHEAEDASGILERIQASLREKMEVQIRSIHQTSSALEEIDALFQTIATSSRTKKESLDVLATQAQEGERRLQQVSGAFAAMQKTAEDVLSVVQVIEDISNRTNLLAMNASIEAAHAGNAGRGFAVVASEIRKLAEETGQNSQAIRQTLDANLAQVHTAVLASQESQKLLATMIRAFQDIQTLLGEQMNGMEEMGQGTQEILHSVADLQAGTQSVQGAAQELEGAVRANRHHSASVKTTTTVLNEGVQALQTVAGAIAGTASQIQNLGQQNHELVVGLRTNLERVQNEMEKRRAALG